MMRASIDTDVVIHLYLSDKQELFFEIFDDIYMHEFLYEKELRNNSYIVYERFKADVLGGKVKIIKNKDIIEMGLKGLFDEYKRDYQVLFDWGEVVAISLAKAMGISAFISDDTKKFGPHASLMEELIEDVIPFAFYELLFLKYISDDFTAKGMHIEFDEVTSKSMRKYPMNFRDRILRTVRRFNKKYGTKRDCNWIDGYCKENEINYKNKMMELKKYLTKM